MREEVEEHRRRSILTYELAYCGCWEVREPDQTHHKPLIIPQLAVNDPKATPLAQSCKSRGMFSRHKVALKSPWGEFAVHVRVAQPGEFVAHGTANIIFTNMCVQGLMICAAQIHQKAWRQITTPR